MFDMIWPLLLIVGSNCVYNICTKSVPENANAFGALTVTYLVSAGISLIIFLFSAGPSNAVGQLGKINWSSFVLAASIIGLEAGYVFLYRAGWKVSNGALTANICLAVALLVIGFLLYKEHISLRQLAGVAVCGLGLFLINR